MERSASAEGEPVGSPRLAQGEGLPFPAVTSFLRKLAWLRASLSAHPAPVPLFVNSVDFRGFSVGDGGGYYMGSIQPILYIFRVSV